MSQRSRTWIWTYDRPVERIWPVLADTARFNEAAGLPKHEIDESPQADGSVRFFSRGKVNGIGLRWEEWPANWVEYQWFEHCLEFANGPLGRLCTTLRLEPLDGGCRAHYRVEAVPRNPVGSFLLATAFFPGMERTITPLFENLGAFVSGERETEFNFKTPALAPGGLERAMEIVVEIEKSSYGHGLARRLADYVLTRQEVDVRTIRPLALARNWGVPERHVIELFLQAVRAGLLRLRWDLLCPRCQVGKGSVVALDQLPDGAHCDSCNIDYQQDYSNNVELAFHPANSIRPLQSGEYCLSGPVGTPHIKVQLTLDPGNSRSVGHGLPQGNYRVRTLEPGPESQFEWREDGFPKIVLTQDSVVSESVCQPDELILANRSSRRRTLVVEELRWVQDALTAKRVTAMQAFRDLFDDEVLRPGDDVEIDRISIMFTDLKGSTELYERIGDPQAYALVRQHFAILGRAVRTQDGALVKTIGDAIMAVFANPRDALVCALRIHADIEKFNTESGKEPILIKLGLHTGRCISVTLNNRLDYYGSAANLAARLQGQSVGGDVVMSPEFADDPLVSRELEAFDLQEGFADLRGFDRPMPYLRIDAKEVSRHLLALDTRH